MILVFDACCIINLLTIDEDDFLLGRLRDLDVKICQKVYSEVQINLKQKYPKDDFDAQLGELFQYTNVYIDFMQEPEREIINCYEESLIKCHSYNKKNGEFYSVLCSSILSRSGKTKVYLYTDDYKAKKDFAGYFADHQIGYIEDTADLLLFIAANDSSFRQVDLLRFINNLRSTYASDYVELYKKLNDHYASFSIKDKKIKLLVFELIGSLKKRDIEEANKVKQKIHYKNNEIIDKLLSHYDSVFQVKFDYIEKLDRLGKHFTKYPLFSIE